MANSLEGLIEVALMRRDLDDAEMRAREALQHGCTFGYTLGILGALEALFDELSLPSAEHVNLSEHDVALAAARRSLGEDRHSSAFTAGQALSLEETIVEALQ
jgi:hypothetical protein